MTRYSIVLVASLAITGLFVSGSIHASERQGGLNTSDSISSEKALDSLGSKENLESIDSKKALENLDSEKTLDSLSIVLTGDILLDRGVRREINKHGVGHLFSDGIDSVFRSAQVVVGNLECPATKIEAPVFKRFIFRGEPEWLDTLKAHGITHLNLANNHSIDQGRDGLLDTKANILKAGMTPIGAGKNMKEASEPVLLATSPKMVWLVPSLRLALENYAYLPDKPCVSQEPMDSLFSRVVNLRQKDSTAVIIVSLHWGGEHTLKPVPRQRYDAHMLIRAGADILVCHHTHTQQTIEDFHGHKIYYSIGNFIFDQQKTINSEACIVRMNIKKDDLEVETIPIEIRHCVPYINKQEDASFRKHFSQ